MSRSRWEAVDRTQGTGSAWTRDAREVQVTGGQAPARPGVCERRDRGLRASGTRGPDCAVGAAGAGAAGPGDSGKAATHRSWCRSRAGACAAPPPLPPLPPPGSRQAGRQRAAPPARLAPPRKWSAAATDPPPDPEGKQGRRRGRVLAGRRPSRGGWARLGRDRTGPFLCPPGSTAVLGRP